MFWRMTMRFRFLVLLLLAEMLSLTGITVASPANSSPSATEGVKVINVTAKKYEFTPAPIQVKQGSTVQLKITATDHVHGFKIKEFADGADNKGKPGLVFASPLDCQRIEKGQSATVEFVAQSPGTYPFRCCIRCGWDHRAMKGQLIVEP
jgi:cytochrome c oxidase subunit II